MRIAYLAKEYPPYGINFASAIFYPKVAEELARRGHEIHVVSQAVKGKETIMYNGVTIHRVGSLSKEGSALGRMRYNFESTRALRSIIEKESIQLVESNVTFGEAAIYSLVRKTPLITQSFAFSDMFLESGSYQGLNDRIALKISSFLEDLTLKRSDKIIANSPATYIYLLSKKRIPKSRLTLISEARIDLARWKPKTGTIRDKLSIAKDEIVVLYVGWLQRRKGAHILFEAIPKILEKIPNTVFLFVGRDPSGTPVEKSYLSHMLNVSTRLGFAPKLKFINSFVSTDELIEIYSACDILAFPSLSETFGWAVVEAMSCGKMVAASNTGIVPELQRLGAYIEVASIGDVESFAKSVLSAIYRTLNERREIEAKNRSIVEQTFNFQRMIDALENLYEEVIR